MKVKDMTLTLICDKMKKPFNFAWCAGIIVITVKMKCALFSKFMWWLYCTIDSISYSIEYLPVNVKKTYYTDVIYRIYEHYGDTELLKKLKFVDSCPMSDDKFTSFTVLDNKWGFLSAFSGKIVIPSAYTKKWYFNKYLAIIADTSLKISYVGINGELVIPIYQENYDFIKISDGYL